MSREEVLELLGSKRPELGVVDLVVAVENADKKKRAKLLYSALLLLHKSRCNATFDSTDLSLREIVTSRDHMINKAAHVMDEAESICVQS